MSTYKNYLFFSGKNIPIFTAAVLLFLVTEVINTIYFRILAQYDLVDSGKSADSWMENYRSFWLCLWMLQIGYFILMVLKYFIINLVILNSNEALHEEMIQSIMRTPCSYFDMTPSGRLVNKFSNDLGLMDSLMAFVFVDAFEGPIISIIMLINIV